MKPLLTTSLKNLAGLYKSITMNGRQHMWAVVVQAFEKQGKLRAALEPDVSLKHLGVDELDLLEITMRLEETLNRTKFFNDEQVLKCRTVRELIEYLYQAQK